MAHPLVDQLRFTRRQWVTAIEGVSDEDGGMRLGPMNSVGWMVAHLAWQEQIYWLTRAQGQVIEPELNEVAAYGGPATTPQLSRMLAAWHRVTAATDPYLDRLTTADLPTAVIVDGEPWKATQGSWLLRVAYHYWFHMGEIMAIRQVLGHDGLPEYVGDLDGLAPYRPEG